MSLFQHLTMCELSELIHDLEALVCSLEASCLASPCRRRRHSRLYLPDLNIFMELHGQRIAVYHLHVLVNGHAVPSLEELRPQDLRKLPVKVA